MITAILLAPEMFAVASIGFWVLFRNNGWSRTFSTIILYGTLGALTAYVAGHVGSLIGDRVYGGKEQFAWGKHYVVTLPLMAIGWLTSAGLFLTTVIGVVSTHLKRDKRYRAG